MTDVALPKISVITVSFNAQRTIDDTIRSVLSQNYPNLEYIILDGQSTDGTASVIERYRDQLSFWRSAPDDGQYAAIEEGFSMSTGDIMCWLNADDLFLPRSLWLVAEVFQQYEAIEWISTLHGGEWDANSYFLGTNALPGFSKQAFFDGLYLPTMRSRGYWIQQESSFWRRGLWERSGARIPKSSGLAGDFALWAEFFQHADLYGLDYPIAGFRAHAGQRSEATERYVAEAKDALMKARQITRWQEDKRNLLRYAKFSRLPRLRKAVQKQVGYVGNRVVNRDSRRAGSGWTIESHRFLP